jgi:hypothetical protein
MCICYIIVFIFIFILYLKSCVYLLLFTCMPLLVLFSLLACYCTLCDRRLTVCMMLASYLYCFGDGLGGGGRVGECREGMYYCFM